MDPQTHQAHARLAGDLRALMAAKAHQERPTAYDRGRAAGSEAGSKTTQILVGIPVTIGFIWLVHLYAPWAIGLAIIVAVIIAVAYIANAVKGS